MRIVLTFVLAAILLAATGKVDLLVQAISTAKTLNPTLNQAQSAIERK